MIITITGASGSGKSSIARILCSRNSNIIHLDIDKISHSLYEDQEVVEELKRAFNIQIVNRNIIGNIVFNDKKAMQILTDITWGRMKQIIDEFINSHPDKIILLDWILINKTEYFNMSSLNILVKADYSLREQRAIARDGITREKFKEREKARAEYDESLFGLIIDNVDLENSKKVVDKIMMKVLYAGSFNPITKGHMDIIDQACKMFDEVVVGILVNPNKKDEFLTLDERYELVKEIYRKNPKVKVIFSTDLAVNVAREYGCSSMIRGIRSTDDFAYEQQLLDVNKQLSNDKVNTIFLFAKPEYQNISSTIVRDLYALGKDISSYVDTRVIDYLTRADDKLQLQVFGSVSPYIKGNYNCPGYLVSSNRAKVLLDCGNGITKYIDMERELKDLTIVISHLHKDHFGDLSTIAYASFVYHNLGLLENRIKVYIPKREDKTGTDYDFITKNPESYLEFIEYDENSVIEINDLRLTFSLNPHQVKTYSVRIDKNNKSITYSSDTGFINNTISKLAVNTDILLCEASFLAGQIRNGNYHLYAKEAGIIACEAHAKKLLLTHTFPECAKEEYVREAQHEFANTEAALEGKIYMLK